MRYEERLAVPRLWYVWAAVCAGAFGSYFTVYADSALARLVAYGAMFAALAAALWLLGRPRLAVTDTSVRAAGRTISRDAVHGSVACTDIRTVLAPGMFALTRPWIRTGVRVDTATGAWVLSSRHPDELAMAINVPVTR